ncbi:MAG: type II toxin-antitoxin system VapC family toxin [Defluviitaleaceae bacterium]|nr:type II toxin-antitoxin system VapC family toxin [Defluviitaleaceae bacterium]
MNTHVLDACALIALLSHENGADKVAAIYEDSRNKIIMNAVNLLEVYYDFYRTHGKATADEMVAHIEASAITIITQIDKAILSEAGRLKASYKISLADAFAVAQAKVTNGILITSDHHELDTIEVNEPIKFLWIR